MTDNWHPKPRRPQDPNPLFKLDDSFVVKGQTPLQLQRQLDGTQHTKTGRTHLHPGNTAPVGDGQPDLYINKSLSNDGDNEPVPENAEKVKKSLDPDAIVKSFLAKGPAPVGGEEKQQQGGKPSDVPGTSGPVKYNPMMGKSREEDADTDATLTDAARSTGGKPKDSAATTAGKKVGGAVGGVVGVARKLAGAVAAVVPKDGR